MDCISNSSISETHPILMPKVGRRVLDYFQRKQLQPQCLQTNLGNLYAYLNQILLFAAYMEKCAR